MGGKKRFSLMDLLSPMVHFDHEKNFVLLAAALAAPYGPFLNDAGEMHGSLVVIEVEDMAAAQAWADKDPYALAGLFADVRIEAWNRVIG